MATDRQILANQRNAQKSTGPRSEEGKGSSRRNATTHGMTAALGITLPETAGPEYERRRTAWIAEFRPTTPEQVWAADKMVAASFQIDRCEARQDALEKEQAARARSAWHDDQALEAEEIAARLAINPPLVVRRLESSRHGCLLLIGRWERLVEAVEAAGDWTEKERSHALDLLALPADLRSGRTPLNPAPGKEAGLWLRDLALTQLGRLRSKNDHSHDGLDDLRRKLASAGLTADMTKAGQLIRRYEREAWSRFHWGRKTLMSPARKAAESADPAPANRPSPQADRPASLIDRMAREIARIEEARRAEAIEAPTRPAVDERGPALLGTIGDVRRDMAGTSLASGKNRQQRRAEKARARRVK